MKKTISTIALLLVAIITFTACNFKVGETYLSTDINQSAIGEMKDQGGKTVSKMALSSIVAGNNVTVTADVIPVTAINKTVSWSTAWVSPHPNSPWTSGKNPSNYISISLSPDTLTASVSLANGFRVPIILTAKSNENPALTASTRVECVNKPGNMTLEMTNIGVKDTDTGSDLIFNFNNATPTIKLPQGLGLTYLMPHNSFQALYSNARTDYTQLTLTNNTDVTLIFDAGAPYNATTGREVLIRVSPELQGYLQQAGTAYSNDWVSLGSVTAGFFPINQNPSFSYYDMLTAMFGNYFLTNQFGAALPYINANRYYYQFIEPLLNTVGNDFDLKIITYYTFADAITTNFAVRFDRNSYDFTVTPPARTPATRLQMTDNNGVMNIAFNTNLAGETFFTTMVLPSWQTIDTFNNYTCVYTDLFTTATATNRTISVEISQIFSSALSAQGLVISGFPGPTIGSGLNKQFSFYDIFAAVFGGNFYQGGDTTGNNSKQAKLITAIQNTGGFLFKLKINTSPSSIGTTEYYCFFDISAFN